MKTMNNVRDALWHDYEEVKEKLKYLKCEDIGYNELLEERDKLRNELIKVEQIEYDNNGRLSQNNFDSRRDNIRNIITITTFVISTGVSLYALNRTFDFDKTSTVTSTAGKGIINGFVPKMLKR